MMPRVKVRNDARLRLEMERAGIDVLLVFSMENVLYLSGALFALQDNLRERLAAAGFTRDGFDFLVAATNELSVSGAQAHVEEIRGYVEFRGTATEVIAALLREKGLDKATLGVEKRYLMAAFYEELKAELPNARFVSGDQALETARAIKTPAQIDRIAHANRMTELALAKTFAECRPGETEKTAALRLIQNLYAAGADMVRHVVFTVGDNAKHAHPFPSDKKRLDPGDIIRVDVGGLFDGQGSDIARMGIVGSPSEAQRAHYRVLLECQRETAAALTSGTRARDVFNRAVEAYGKRGVDYRRDHVGHSLSILGGHDNPLLHPANEMVLEENMVIALEPIFPDQDGRRYTVEDIFVVTHDGGLLLTDATDTEAMQPIGAGQAI